MAIGKYPKFLWNNTLREVFADPQVQAEFPELQKVQVIPDFVLDGCLIGRLFTWDSYRIWVRRLTGATNQQIDDWGKRFWQLFAASNIPYKGTLADVADYQAQGSPLHPEVQRMYDKYIAEHGAEQTAAGLAKIKAELEVEQ